MEETISTGATTAQTIEQLEIEVQTLKGLEPWRWACLRSGQGYQVDPARSESSMMN